MAFSKANSTTGHLKGVDLSHYQPSASINWNTLKNVDNISFVYLRACLGYVKDYQAGVVTDPKGYMIDTQVVNHIRNAKGVGLPVGFYHFSHMAQGASYDINEADAEATFFANTIASSMTSAGYSGYGDLLPVLDLEMPNPDNPSASGLTASQIMNWAKRFCNVFTSLTGRQIMVYTSRYFYNQFGITEASNLLKTLPLWNAEYYQYTPMPDDTPPSYGGFNDWTVWQHSQTGRIQAYSADVDLNWGPKDLCWLMPPTTPTGLNALSPAGTQVSLQWNQNPELDIARYDVYNGSVKIGTTAGTNYSITSGLTAGSSYTFKVQAVDQYGDVSPLTNIAFTVTNAPMFLKNRQRLINKTRSLNKVRLINKRR